MPAYYNELDPFAAQWLRNLIATGLVPAGDVDERSIVDVSPDDIRGYRQHHFFAGIGGWPYALALAGWGDRPVWTGSCPCQPLSSAGQRKGHVDERHLWPAFYRLIAECRPATLFGEQVASKDGREWLAGVRADLEDLEYAFGAADLCAASAGAPHIRQRLFWVADSGHWQRRESPIVSSPSSQNEASAPEQRRNGLDRIVEYSGATGGLADSNRERYSKHALLRKEQDEDTQTAGGGAAGGLGDAAISRERSFGRQSSAGVRPQQQDRGSSLSFWSDAEWLPCLDGKSRRIEPGTFPLAEWLPRSMAALGPELGELARMAGLHGRSLANAKGYRVGSLRGYGNAIVAQAAAEFVAAFMECAP